MMMCRWAVIAWMLCLFLVYIVETQPTTVFTITPTSTVVQEITTYTFNITISGNVNNTFIIPAGTNIIINFPSAYASAPTTVTNCTLPPSWPVPNAAQCSLTYNSLTITNVFLSNYTPALNDQLLFVVSPITNPSFVQTINRPHISGVFSYNFTNLLSFMPVSSISIQSGVLGVNISVSPTDTDYAFSTLTIAVAPAHQIPVGGSLRITMDRYYLNVVNPSSPINQALTCQAIYNASDNLFCNYTTSLSSAIVSVFNISTVATNIPFVFTLYPFKNPPTTQPFIGLTFATSTLITNGLNIDVSSNNRIRGFTPALAQYPTADFSSKLIGSKTKMTITLTVNNAISPSDTITITTPPDIGVTLVDSVNMGGSQGTLTPISTNIFKFTNIDVYSPASPIQLVINNLVLPSYAASISSPFIMLITRNNNFDVCKMNATFIIKLDPGSIAGVLNPTNKQAGMLSNYSFLLNFKHSIQSSSQITFFFNTDFSIDGNLNCTSTASNNCTATSVKNLVTVTSPTIVTTNTLTITLINIDNPSSIGNFAPIIVTTYLQVSSAYYLLDSNNLFAFFTVSARPMGYYDLNVSALSYKVHNSTTFTLSIRNNNYLPGDSNIWLIFPKQIDLNSMSCVSTCVAGAYNSSNGVQLQQLGPLPANSVSTFTIRNVITPISTKPTSPFAVYIFDSLKNMLEYLDFGTNFQADSPSLLTVIFSAQQLKNSFVGWFNLTYTPRYPITQAVSLILTVPNSLSCPTCPYNSNSQMIFQDQIMSGGRYTLNLPNFTYFYSTEQIILSAAIMTNDLFFFYANCTFSLTNKFSSAPVFTYSFTTYQRKTIADLIISNFSSATFAQRVSSVKIVIRYGFDYSIANCNNNIGYNCSVNNGTFVLTVLNTNTSLKSFIISNIITPSSSPSTFISVYTLSSAGFLIDQSDIIFWQSDCSIPCKKCGTSVTQCLSCYSDLALAQNMIYYFPLNSTCVSDCGERYYKNQTTNTCYPCSSSCYNCYDRTFCTSCPTGHYLLFQNKTCYATCPSGYFQKNSYCVPCSADLNCYTCTHEFTCQSCYKFYLHQSQCIPKCPQPKTVANSVNYTCDPCPTNCSTCSLVNKTVKCLSCTSGLLDNGACVQSCITYKYAPNDLVCSPCDQTCKNCLGSTTFCTSCNTSSKYAYFLKNKCYQKCPDTYYNDQQSYLCMPCISPCQNCYNYSSNVCITCRWPYSQLGTTCNTICPSQYYVNGPLCSSCGSPCLTCTSAADCSTCVQNFTFYSPNSSCLTSCPETYVSVNQTCISCSFNCYNCIAVTLCSSCRKDSFILNYTCYNPCPVGYYSDSYSASCKICVNYCTACSSATVCIACSSGYSLSNNSCINLCGNSQVSINGVCINCNSNCTACQTSVNNCTGCASGFLFAASINACLRSCPSTLYYDPTTQTCPTACPSATYITINSQNVSICMTCPNYCSSCVSSSQCVACVTGTYFSENKCLQRCTDNQPFAFNFKCQTCNVLSCLSCIGTSCVVCQSGLYLIGDSLCITGCSSLQVYNPTNKTCDTIITNSSNNSSGITISAQESSVVNLNFIPMPFLIMYIIIGIVVFLLHLNSKLSAVPTLLGIIGPFLFMDILVAIFISLYVYTLKTLLLSVVIYNLVAALGIGLMLSVVCVRLRYKLTACQKSLILVLSLMHHDAMALLTANINYYNSFFIEQHKYFWKRYRLISKIGLLLFFPIFFSGIALVFAVADRSNYLFYAGIQLCILVLMQLLLTLAWIWLPMQPVPQKQKSTPSALSEQSTEQVSDAQNQSFENQYQGQPNEKGSSMQNLRLSSTKKEEADPEEQIRIRSSQIRSEGDQLQKKSSQSNRAKSNYQFNQITGVVKVQTNDIQKALERGLFRRNQEQILKEIKEEEQYSKIDDAQKLNSYLKKQEDQAINIFEDFADNELEQLPISPKIQPLKQQFKADTVKTVQIEQKKPISKKESEGSMGMFDEPLLVKEQDFHHNIIFQQDEQENQTYYQGQSYYNEQKQLIQPFQLESTPSLGSIIHQNTDKIKISQINNSPRLISPQFDSNRKESKIIVQDFEDSLQQSHINIFNTGNSRIRPKFSKQLGKAQPPKEIIHADFQEIATVSDGGSLEFIEFQDYDQHDSSRKIVNKRINQNIHDHLDNNFSRPSDILRQASIHYQPQVQRNSAPKNPAAQQPLPRFSSKLSRRK